MYSFMILVWNPANTRGARAARLLTARLQSARTDWIGVPADDGVCLFHRGGSPGGGEAYTLGSQAGAVLGTLFTRTPGGASIRAGSLLSVDESAAIVRSEGRRLISHYWGQYVAVVHDRRAGRTFILRDPAGFLPCFETQHEGVRIYFSHAEDALQLGLPPFSINWEYITAAVCLVGLKIRATGLKEVSEVEPGQCIEIEADQARRLSCWNPAEIACQDPIDDPGETLRIVRETVADTVHAWASCHDSLLHSLSGGLDSSIVLSCLRSAPNRPAITCFNYWFREGWDDERRYARMAAAAAGSELRERRPDIKAVKLERILDVRAFVRPHFFIYDLLHGDFEGDLASERGATGVLTGQGGDHVFMQHGAEHAVGDYLRLRGLRPGLMRAARDAARITRRSVWSLLRQGLREGRAESHWAPYSAAVLSHFVHPDVRAWLKQNESFVAPPQLAGATTVPAGKLRHIDSMMMLHPGYRAFERPGLPEQSYPLFSQPVLEMCLKIPTYRLISGGWDRSPYRAAFENDIPKQIARRRGKGVSDHTVKDLLESNMPFLTELLLDGILVKERLLDRQKLEAFLRGSRSGARVEYNELYVSRISQEAWLRRWSAIAQRAAA